MSSGDFGFQEFGNTYTSPTISSFADNIGNLQPIQPNPQAVYPAVGPQQQHQAQHNGYAPSASRIGDKHKPEVLSPTVPLNFEEQTRVAAEEDKRRRNTAASARFRIKKKQREQALEKSAKEMMDKVTALEGRIQQLETENKWLKNIVLEKNGGNEELLSKLLSDFNTKNIASLKKEMAEALETRVPTSPEEREAGDSSG